MFKPNVYVRMSSLKGRLAVDRSLIELFRETVCCLLWSTYLYHGSIKQITNRIRKSLTIMETPVDIVFTLVCFITSRSGRKTRVIKVSQLSMY